MNLFFHILKFLDLWFLYFSSVLPCNLFYGTWLCMQPLSGEIDSSSSSTSRLFTTVVTSCDHESLIPFNNEYRVEGSEQQAWCKSGEMMVCAGSSAQLPTFWRDDPEGWFLNCESQFYSKSITQDVTKYHYCVAKLDSDTSRCVRDLVRATVTEESYG